MGAFTKVPADTFEKIQLNAGIICKSFVPSTKAVTGQIGATMGGVNYEAVPTFQDFGEDIDNVPNNTMELKRIQYYTVTLSGTLVTVDADVTAKLVAAADVDGGKVTPRTELKEDDFEDLWWVGDYGEDSFIAIKVIKALSTGGFKVTSTKDGKGQFAFEFTGHYSLNDQDTVPFEVYVGAA